jgi:TatD DNase family protein
MFLVDSHCHLYLLDLTSYENDLQKVLLQAQAEGVQHILNVCVKLSDLPGILSVANQYSFISASVGVHPNERSEVVSVEQLIALGQNQKVVAVGETGLDYFRSVGEVEWQRERFRQHIRAARELNKPLIIHMRHATADTFRIMREEKAETVGGVMHCFTEDWVAAQQALALNFYISFSGIVTFKGATVVQEVARQVPLHRMLIETDAPYLTPDPQRGKPNYPFYVRYTAEYLAKLRGITLSELAEQTTKNFFTVFHGAQK